MGRIIATYRSGRRSFRAHLETESKSDELLTGTVFCATVTALFGDTTRQGMVGQILDFIVEIPASEEQNLYVAAA
jgi:hypothetical protein